MSRLHQQVLGFRYLFARHRAFEAREPATNSSKTNVLDSESGRRVVGMDAAGLQALKI